MEVIQAFKRILSSSCVTSMTNLSQFGMLLLLYDTGLRSYNLHTLAGFIGGVQSQEAFAGSMERLTGQDMAVAFFGAGEVAGRTLGMLEFQRFGSKSSYTRL